MQGQEAEAVVVSYGVSDPEFALREAEFIYSRNRLNVSITRARSKCFVFLPQPLLEPPPEALSSDVAAAGIAYMQGLVALATERGQEQRFRLAPAVEARIVRIRAT